MLLFVGVGGHNHGVAVRCWVGPLLLQPLPGGLLGQGGPLRRDKVQGEGEDIALGPLILEERGVDPLEEDGLELPRLGGGLGTIVRCAKGGLAGPEGCGNVIALAVLMSRALTVSGVGAQK